MGRRRRKKARAESNRIVRSLSVTAVRAPGDDGGTAGGRRGSYRVTHLEHLRDGQRGPPPGKLRRGGPHVLPPHRLAYPQLAVVRHYVRTDETGGVGRRHPTRVMVKPPMPCQSDDDDDATTMATDREAPHHDAASRVTPPARLPRIEQLGPSRETTWGISPGTATHHFGFMNLPPAPRRAPVLPSCPSCRQPRPGWVWASLMSRNRRSNKEGLL